VVFALLGTVALVSLATITITVVVIGKLVVQRSQRVFGERALEHGATGLYAAADYQRSLGQLSVEADLRGLAQIYRAIGDTQSSP
jgi:hypothetical protein